MIVRHINGDTVDSSRSTISSRGRKQNVHRQGRTSVRSTGTYTVLLQYCSTPLVLVHSSSLLAPREKGNLSLSLLHRRGLRVPPYNLSQMAMTRTSTSQQGDGDNEFHSVQKKKIGSNKNHRTRVYVGNLPSQWNPDDLRSLIVQRTGVVAESGVELYHHQDGRESFTGTPQQAFVAVAGMGPEELLIQLRGIQLQGQPLVVHLEKRQRKNVGQNTFNSLAWSKPKVQPQSKARNPSIVNDEKEQKTDGSSQSARREPNTFQTFAAQQSLSALLQDFGAQDAEWQNVQVTEGQQKQHGEHDEHIVACSLPDSRLERHGKAPIHVEFVSFGYRHGLPSELRAASTGNSYAFPLPEIDCRCLAEIPHFLSWMDGTSGAVRNAMLKANTNNGSNSNNINNPHVRDFVRDSLVQPVIQAVISAINEGGHGYAMPLRMTVFVGSEQGRHRAVVACELAATSLRKALRQNENNQFVASISVGTNHRDMAQQQAQKRRKNDSIPTKKGTKQNDFEDAW